jgi:hypothetical protein
MTGRFKVASGTAFCTDCPAGKYKDTAGDAKVGAALDAISSLCLRALMPRRQGHLFADISA